MRCKTFKIKKVMAIKKKGNVDYLNNVTPASLSLNDADSSVSNEVDSAPGINVGKQESVNRTKKKSLENWGRPRKSLIEGVKEVSVTIQLPETLLKALRKEAKKTGKSMKELIGTSLLSTYSVLLK